ncbi:hypothetical protein [uncultured Brachybacterium sp.]|uniref:hypothetical protein n=1 Tax=uncultured Brachybacterium sp. TaxID=189680 RepID=UPI002626D97B|nr:hypothetical protein [uncultured Brachybacterium sp.]
MSTQITASEPRTSFLTRALLAGDLTLAAGVLGAVAGVALAVWPREVAPDQFSYPLGTASFVAFQLFFAVHHLGLLVGILALGSLNRMVATRATRAGIGLAAAGMVALIAMEAAVAFLGLGITATSERGQVLGALYGVASLMIGVGLIVAGVGLARQRVFDGIWRYLPLALGVWVFVPMVPALFAPMVWGRLAIVRWMVLFAVLGMQLRRTDQSALRP